ncbi:Crp/Fnr family transcriptional regulator [Phytohabitans suffuscus]|uniref:Crp/Fnr family transcriptional regulator n=1 Tax=Phytohabitans suffuscus TaxID=624315 RepID=A0A6F8Z0B1_9ACTN|nr:Crp/Fnr family transcriptional regulator [Phytohabitans suffuscus]
MTVLVFSRTTGYRHDSIAAGIEAFRQLSDGVVATEDPRALEDLAGADAVVFLNTNGEVLTGAGRAALEAYVRGGGGFLGVHSAAATEYGWPFYGDLLGARFDKHPAVQPATIEVSDPDHPSTAHLPAAWPRVDEWYDFRSRPDARVLLRLDESTYSGGGWAPTTRSPGATNASAGAPSTPRWATRPSRTPSPRSATTSPTP